MSWSQIGNTEPAVQKKVEARNKRIEEMVDAACTKGGKSGTHVRPLQALNLVPDGCERVRAERLGCVDFLSCSVLSYMHE